MITFSAKHLKPLAVFMAKQDIRFYLNAIHIDPHKDGGAVLVATNGHMLLAIRDVNAVCSEPTTFHFNRDALKYIKNSYKGDPDALAEIEPETQRLTIRDVFGNEAYIQPGKCFVVFDKFHKYPEWRNVMPKFDQLNLAVVDPVSVPLLVKAISIHPLSSNVRLPSAVRFWQQEENSSLVIEYVGCPEMCGVVMPLRAISKDLRSKMDDWQASFGKVAA